MQHQQTFELTKSAELLPPGKVKPRCPVPKSQKRKSLFVHFAFDRMLTFPPPPMTRQERPKQIQVDESRFVQSNILPHPEWPLCCKHILLPAFETEKEMAAHIEAHHCPTILKWLCWFCRCYHHWGSAPNCTDTNGNFSAGSDEAPERILKEFMDPRNKRLFWFRHKLEATTPIPPPR